MLSRYSPVRGKIKTPVALISRFTAVVGLKRLWRKPVVICTCKHNLPASDLPGDKKVDNAGCLVSSVNRKSRRVSFQRTLSMSLCHMEYLIFGSKSELLPADVLYI